MFDWPHRTYCDTLEEQRKLVRSINIFNYKRVKAILLSLIEENQTYGNRMEAGLSYKEDLDGLHKKRKKLRKEVDLLKEQVKMLKDTVGIAEEKEEREIPVSLRRMLDDEDED